jgi:hypothetical protein
MRGFYLLSLESCRWAPRGYVTMRRFVGTTVAAAQVILILVGRVVGAKDEVYEDCTERKE